MTTPPTAAPPPMPGTPGNPGVPTPPRRPAKFPRWLIVVGLLAIVFVVGVAVAFIKAVNPRAESGTILIVRLEGQLQEAQPDNPFAMLFGGGGQTMSLAGLRHLADALADDKKIAGVLLEIGPLQTGLASIDEAREAITRIRATRKPVYAVLVGDFVEEKDYLLATAADRVIMSPESGALLNGFVAEAGFYRGTLDKLHIEPQIFQFKEYKSAAEPFMNKEMSAPMREELTAILDGFFDHFVSVVAERRGISKDAFKALVDKGGLTSKEALDAKLVDELGYPQDVEAALRKAAGVVGKPQRMRAGQYLQSADEPTHGDAIAVIYAVGSITASAGGGSLFGDDGIHGPVTAKHIREAAEDDDVKAIILRVNSPGGSAVGSDFIWRAIKEAREKKPVVVSMGDVAGSGGYWISMGADAIVAQPTTITGSIGVVGGKFNLRGLYELAGANVDSVKVGANADLMSQFRNFDEAQTERWKAWMGAVYDDFVHRAAEGRHLTAEGLEPLAHGRIWTGDQAKERKLIDDVGGFDRAVEVAREEAKIGKDAKTHLERFPKPKGLFELLRDGDMPGATVLTGEVTVSGELDRALAELETLQPWALAPTIRIH